jgi:hypothetical protein
MEDRTCSRQYLLRRLATELEFLIGYYSKRKTKKGQKSYVAFVRLRHLNGHKASTCTAHHDDDDEGGDGDKAKAEGTEEEDEDQPGEENPNNNNLFTR